MEKQKLIQLSRKKNKTDEERYLLYDNIKELIVIQDISTLYFIFYPKIYKTSIQIFNIFKRKIPLEDILQDSYLIFYDFIDNYDASKSTLTYHMKKNFFSYFRMSIKKKYKHIFHEISIINLQNYIDKRPSLLKSLLCANLEDEIRILLKTHSQKGKLIKTCDKYKLLEHLILEEGDITEIAQSLNISYHAVYQIKNRAKLFLAEGLNQSTLCSYNIDTSHIYYSASHQALGQYKLQPR